MNEFHALLGIAVVVLNVAAGLRGLMPPRGREPQPNTLAGWAHGALTIQVASGFFLFTAAAEGPGVLHYLLPGAALAAVFGARLVDGLGRERAIGIASLFAAAASLFAFLSGTGGG